MGLPGKQQGQQFHAVQQQHSAHPRQGFPGEGQPGIAQGQEGGRSRQAPGAAEQGRVAGSCSLWDWALTAQVKEVSSALAQ